MYEYQIFTYISKRIDILVKRYLHPSVYRNLIQGNQRMLVVHPLKMNYEK